jgi:hypothetical protein
MVRRVNVPSALNTLGLMPFVLTVVDYFSLTIDVFLIHVVTSSILKVYVYRMLYKSTCSVCASTMYSVLLEEI